MLSEIYSCYPPPTSRFFMQVPRNILCIYFSLLLGSGNDCKNEKNSELVIVNGSASSNWVENYPKSRVIPALVTDASQWNEYRFRKTEKAGLRQMQKPQSPIETSLFCSIPHPQSHRNCTTKTQSSAWSQRKTDFRWGRNQVEYSTVSVQIQSLARAARLPSYTRKDEKNKKTAFRQSYCSKKTKWVKGT